MKILKRKDEQSILLDDFKQQVNYTLKRYLLVSRAEITTSSNCSDLGIFNTHYS